MEYAAISEPHTLDWIAARKPSRIVIVNFGARNSTLDQFLDALQHRLLPSPPVIVAVGGEAKVYSLDEFQEYKQSSPRLGKIQLNSSGVRDQAMRLESEESYFEKLSSTWDQWRKDGGARGMEICWGHGIGSDEGIEGGWTQLCEGRVKPGMGLVYRTDMSLPD